MLKLIDKLRREETQVKILLAGMIVLTIALLLPLFIIARYSVKSADDFIYFRDPESVWQSTHSLFALCREQAVYAYDYWTEWQGTYFSEWLTTVMMGLCGDQYYFVCSYLALGGLVLSELLAFKMIFVNFLKADFYRTGILALGCILMQILLMPFPVEAFYWFCGTAIYTWIFVLAILLVALVCSLLTLPEKTKRWRVIVREAGILFLSFAVAGGNYVSLMFVFILYAAGLFLLWLYKHRYRVLMSFNFLFYLGCVLLAVCAPGNQKRLTASNAAGYSVIGSILQSLKEAAFYINQWTLLPYILVGMMLAPVMWQMVRARKLKYPVPFLVSVITFGMFAALFTPNLYTLGIIGAGRTQNIYRMTMLFWLYGNEFYWIGWFSRKRTDSREEKGNEGKQTASWLLPGFCVGLALTAFSMVLWGGDTVTTVSAVKALKSGQARQYKAEYEARLQVLQDDTVKDVVFEPYSEKPYLLFFTDIVENPEDWVNNSVAEVFGKNSVRLAER
ncbi:MAG: DUF6056 family protein [Lachnospiraceae bacterium]